MLPLLVFLAAADPIDNATVTEWRESCAALDGPACLALADTTMASFGLDLARAANAPKPFYWRWDQAKYWYAQACIAGESEGCDHIDVMTENERDADCMQGVRRRCERLPIAERLELCEQAPSSHPVCAIGGDVLAVLPSPLLDPHLLTRSGVARLEGLFDADGNRTSWTTAGVADIVDGNVLAGPNAQISLHSWAGELVIVSQSDTGTNVRFGDTEWQTDKVPVRVVDGGMWHREETGELWLRPLDGSAEWEELSEPAFSRVAGEQRFRVDNNTLYVQDNGAARVVVSASRGAAFWPSPTGRHVAVDHRLTVDESTQTDLIEVATGAVLFTTPGASFRGWSPDGESVLLGGNAGSQLMQLDGTVTRSFPGYEDIQVLGGVALINNSVLVDLDGAGAPFDRSFEPMDNGEVITVVELGRNVANRVTSADGSVLGPRADYPHSRMWNLVNPAGDLLRIQSSVVGPVRYEVLGDGVAHAIDAEVQVGRNVAKLEALGVRGRIREGQDVVIGVLSDGSIWPVRAASNGHVELSHPDLERAYAMATRLDSDVPLGVPSGPRVTVKDCAGEPIADVVISAKDASGRRTPVGLTASNGVAIVDESLLEDATELTVPFRDRDRTTDRPLSIRSGANSEVILHCSSALPQGIEQTRLFQALFQQNYVPTDPPYVPLGTYREAMAKADVYGWAEVESVGPGDVTYRFVPEPSRAIAFVDEQGQPAVGMSWSSTEHVIPNSPLHDRSGARIIGGSSSTGTLMLPTSDVIQSLNLPTQRYERSYRDVEPLTAQLPDEVVLAGSPLQRPVDPTPGVWTRSAEVTRDITPLSPTTDELKALNAIFITDDSAIVVHRFGILYSR